jgi:DNA-binding cell septation regulator SpoVG
MKVLSLERSSGPGNVLAIVSVQITPEIRAHDLRLVRAGSGNAGVLAELTRF